jgi:hypothetical protein
MQTVQSIQSISQRINQFDFFYEMSDDHSKYCRGLQEEASIKGALSSLSNQQLTEVKKSISADEEFVNRYFKTFFAEINEEEEKKDSLHSRIFKAAWSMLKSGIFKSFSDALKAAWNRNHLIKKLKEGIAYFAYAKADGAIREAIGTLRDGNYYYEPKGSQNHTNEHVIKYFDIESRGFRSCRIDRLISIS